MTAIGPVDLMCRDAEGLSVAVEIKRRGEIDGVEQLTRYLELLNRDPLLTSRGPVRGIYAAQEIKPQARVLATDRGIACALVDYDALRGMDDGAEHRLFYGRSGSWVGQPRRGRRLVRHFLAAYDMRVRLSWRHTAFVSAVQMSYAATHFAAPVVCRHPDGDDRPSRRSPPRAGSRSARPPGRPRAHPASAERRACPCRMTSTSRLA